IAGARRHFVSNAVGQRRFSGIVAVRDRRFCALLDIENAHERQARAVRPARIRWLAAVTDEISLVIGLHFQSDAAGKAFPRFSAKSSRSWSPRGPAMKDRPTGQPSTITAGIFTCGNRHRLATQVRASVFSRNSTCADTGASRNGGRSCAVGRTKTPSLPSSVTSRSVRRSRLTTAAANFSGSTRDDRSIRSATAGPTVPPGLLPQPPSLDQRSLRARRLKVSTHYPTPPLTTLPPP